jgi:hypothetical protein
MVVALSQSVLLLLFPVMYFLGAYLEKDLKFIEVVLVSLFSIMVAYVFESSINPTYINWVATIPECGAFMLGYFVHRILR